YLDSDVVFGVRSSLLGRFVEHAAGETAPDGTPMHVPFATLEHTFVLAAAP
ncbi:MAG TPA: hydroxyquinol 1,2-dioxygenase, partial [Burkholderiaceae bacterium]|nr:hydroxyquinol 1,2-dioxygenase [Burkholderiaceae bacterium]